MRLTIPLAAVGLVLGGYSLAVARATPAYSPAGGSFAASLALCVAGWALIASGAAFALRRPGNAVGPLLALTGAAWFVAEWDNPGVGSPVVFTIGLALGAVCPALAGWALLAYPDGRLHAPLERAAVAVALATGLLVLGVLPALAYDPAAQGCSQCPDNLLLVHGDADLVDRLGRAGMWLGLASAVLLAGVAAWRLARSRPGRRRVVGPVVLTGCAYLALVAWTFAANLDQAFVGNGELERRLWLGQAAALSGLGLAVGWGLLESRHTRRRVAGLVVQLGGPASAGGLRRGLADALGEPDIEVAYPVGDGRFAAADGSPVVLDARPDRVATPFVRDGRTVAVLLHDPGLADRAERVQDVAAAAGLALEHERLQAQARAQLAELRSSRARIVEAGDAERRRLERDLHDGAQQRLVSLALALRLLRGRLGDADPEAVARLAAAEAELRLAVDELRELAHGIHPAVLTDEGAAAAFESLSEGASTPLRILGAPEGRFPPAAETAAYLVVAAASRAGPAKVTAAQRDGVLVVEVEAAAEPDGLLDLEDRILALDGSLAVARAAGGAVTIRAEIPCGS